MLEPTSRLLQVLELLQTEPLVTGREIADRLGIDRRTVRRYVAALQRLGIPIEGARGVGGGYRMRPGYRLPPLMLSDDEATAVVFGLLTARQLGLREPVDGALAKLERVLPAALRRRVDALARTLAFTSRPTGGEPVAGDTVLLLAEAIRRRRRVEVDYRSRDGEQTSRELSPHGLVVHSGRWYLAAHDHGRDALRTFRVDRMEGAAVAREPAHPQPLGYNATEHVTRALARVLYEHEVEVLLHLPPEEAETRISPTLAELAPDGDGTLLRMRVSSLDWVAGVLAGLECDFTIRTPPELDGAVRALADRLLRASPR
jgi:predicted DNA-binding transcriptional regulator YafY